MPTSYFALIAYQSLRPICLPVISPHLLTSHFGLFAYQSFDVRHICGLPVISPYLLSSQLALFANQSIRPICLPVISPYFFTSYFALFAYQPVYGDDLHHRFGHHSGASGTAADDVHVLGPRNMTVTLQCHDEQESLSLYVRTLSLIYALLPNLKFYETIAL